MLQNITSIFAFLQVYRDGVLSHYIDGSYDPENWMKFVNCARHKDEQTLVVVQDGERIYYEACRDVYEGEELLVWYGDMYEMFLGIPVGIRTRTMKDQPKLQPEGNNLIIIFYTLIRPVHIQISSNRFTMI